MLQQARENHLDCVKLPDDFPVQFGSDIYRVGAMRKLTRLLNAQGDSIYKVHPKFYMFAHLDQFLSSYARQVPGYSDEYLRRCRQIAQSVYRDPRLEVNESRIWAGDQLSFHYELAMQYLQPGMSVLDVACGDGYGTRMLARKIARMQGADIDPDTIAVAKKLTSSKNVLYHIEDVTNMTFGANEFDAITSMETIEHVDDRAYMKEVYRVLKPGGILILSTPQNRLGHIPVNAVHIREYSLDEITGLCSQYFTVKHVLGIKAGRIILPGDPYGSNTVLVCAKE
jgi:2-polyprenyl-3-methyl-5-hydroxy-6-metoxy-1,4-benzoquinol methylase